MSSFNWKCPYCGNDTTLIEGQSYSFFYETFDLRNVHEKLLAFSTRVFVCPNPECKKITIENILSQTKYNAIRYVPDFGNTIAAKRFQPKANMMVLPDYVPKAIINDYEEACTIVEDSPKAAATLCRRCLQGMIRDFWGIAKGRLKDEIDALKERIDPITWDVIDSIREIGNIGAHMEKDVNLIIDVEIDEAKLLIKLIETLITDWYIQRYNREQNALKIKQIAETKKPKRESE